MGLKEQVTYRVATLRTHRNKQQVVSEVVRAFTVGYNAWKLEQSCPVHLLRPYKHFASAMQNSEQQLHTMYEAMIADWAMAELNREEKPQC